MYLLRTILQAIKFMEMNFNFLLCDCNQGEIVQFKAVFQVICDMLTCVS